MTKEKLTPRQEEIQLLERLLEIDGYFSDKFKKDILIMISNIKNDWPIELGISDNKEINDLKTANTKMELTINDKRAAIDQLNDAIVRKIVYIETLEAQRQEILNQVIRCEHTCTQVRPEALFTVAEIIIEKVGLGYGLNSDEQEYIKTKLNS